MTNQLPFERLGPYRVTGILGRGGMGTVFAAVEQATGKPAAVKVLAPGLAASDSFRDRFAAEIESLKKLNHPAIVQLFGYGEQAGQLFYAMELVPGHSLQYELQHGRRFDWREVTDIGVQVCAALKHAHDHGVIHRDLKPANLLLDEQGQIKLFDFGIAKLFGVTALTTGSVLGTADYMAPEQAEGRSVDHRADLYSLGAMMYALLAGRPPFTGKTVAEVVHKLRFNEPIPVSRIAEDVPVELEELIEQLLHKDPKHRVPTALALSHRLSAMRHALTAHPPPRASTTPPRRAQPDKDRHEDDRLLTDIAERPTVDLEQSTPATHQTDVQVAPDALTSEGPGHFTRVAPRGSSADPSTGVSWAMTLLRLAGLATVLVLLITALWLLFRPPSADRLYQQVIQNAEDETAGTATEVRRDAARFLTLYPDDPRRAEIERIQERMELDRLDRQLALQARRRRDTSQSPVEQLYIDAVRHLPHAPAEAMTRFQALIDLYGQQDPPDEAERFLQLAQRHVKRLQQDIRANQDQHRRFVQQRLDHADRIAPSDPERAAAIRAAVIRLYGDQAWAADLVRRAKTCLPAPQP